MGIGGRGLPTGGVSSQIVQLDENDIPQWMRGIPVGGNNGELLGIGTSGLEWVGSGSDGFRTITSYPSDFTTLSAAGNTTPAGMWSDGTTLYVLDNGDPNLQVFAYTIATKARDLTKGFNVGLRVNSAGGLASNGTTIYVAYSDGNHNAFIKAYNLATRLPDTSKDFDDIW